MAVAALAIERYKLRVGKVPADLAALVPEYLPAIPHDFMDGNDLHYRPSSDGKTYLLYSVGDDGKDDGGDPSPVKTATASHRGFWDGRDAVWPQPASAEEARTLFNPLKSN